MAKDKQIPPQPAAGAPGQPAPKQPAAPPASSTIRTAPLEHYPQGIDQARFVEFGLNTSDSEAAKQLGVAQHSLNPQQVKEVSNIAGESFSKPPRIFERIFDYLATFVSAIIGLFTGGPSFGSFGKMRAERTAMRSAEKTHKMLVAKGYETLADRVSGIQPDGKGDYAPLLDDEGKRTGLLGREITKITDPRRLDYLDAADAGLAPSPVQVERGKEIYAEEMAKLYSSPEVHQRVVKYREHLKAFPGKNEEIPKFLEENKDAIASVVDRMIQDDAIKKGGRFNYEQHREAILQQVREAVAKDHQTLFEKYTPDANAATAKDKVAAANIAPGQYQGTHIADTEPVPAVSGNTPRVSPVAATPGAGASPASPLRR